MYFCYIQFGCRLIYLSALLKNRLLYSKLCYFRTPKVEMIKFVVITANCVRNDL